MKKQQKTIIKPVVVIIVLAILAFLFSIYVEINTVNPKGQFTVVKETTIQQQQPAQQQQSQKTIIQPRTETQPMRTTIFFYGTNLVATKSDTIQYYHQDVLGSNRFTTSSNGRVTSENTQYPYGAKFSEKGAQSTYTFTGKEQDQELYYYGARYYDPAAGRFISVDPVQNSAVSPYPYAADNPLKFVDPDGMTIRLGDSYLEAFAIFQDISEAFPEEIPFQLTEIDGSYYLTKNSQFQGSQYPATYALFSDLIGSYSAVAINRVEDAIYSYETLRHEYDAEGNIISTTLVAEKGTGSGQHIDSKQTPTGENTVLYLPVQTPGYSDYTIDTKNIGYRNYVWISHELAHAYQRIFDPNTNHDFDEEFSVKKEDEVRREHDLKLRENYGAIYFDLQKYQEFKLNNLPIVDAPLNYENLEYPIV